jgi:hypothetical protein
MTRTSLSARVSSTGSGPKMTTRTCAGSTVAMKPLRSPRRSGTRMKVLVVRIGSISMVTVTICSGSTVTPSARSSTAACSHVCVRPLMSIGSVRTLDSRFTSAGRPSTNTLGGLAVTLSRR